jgi:beta-lactamase superfamily II metal-dependent hydrolase
LFIHLQKTFFKLGGALVVLSLIITAACTNIDTTSQGAAAPAADAGSKDEAAKPQLRTDEVFDKVKYKDDLTIHYFHLDGDTAMGDSVLIQTPEGHTMLIDAGVAEAGSQIVKYLTKLGIDTIDVAVNTHPHADHIGGFAMVASTKTIKQVYMENLPYPNSKSYTNAMAAFKRKNVPIKFVERGDSFTVGDELKIDVLNPPKGELPGAVKSFEASELNYYSLVLKMTYKDQTFLFNGDIYKNREGELVELFGKKLDSDFMSAPHHGNDTSSSAEYIHAVSPQVAVACNNIFSKLTVMQRYDRSKVKFYSTGLQGNVLIVADGKSLMKVVTEKDWNAPPGLLKNQ